MMIVIVEYCYCMYYVFYSVNLYFVICDIYLYIYRYNWFATVDDVIFDNNTCFEI